MYRFSNVREHGTKNHLSEGRSFIFCVDVEAAVLHTHGDILDKVTRQFKHNGTQDVTRTTWWLYGHLYSLFNPCITI